MPEGTIVEPAGSGADDLPAAPELVTDAARLRERALFLRELAEARALLARNTLWRARPADTGERLRSSTNPG